MFNSIDIIVSPFYLKQIYESACTYFEIHLLKTLYVLFHCGLTKTFTCCSAVGKHQPLPPECLTFCAGVQGYQISQKSLSDTYGKLQDDKRSTNRTRINSYSEMSFTKVNISSLMSNILL